MLTCWNKMENMFNIIAAQHPQVSIVHHLNVTTFNRRRETPSLVTELNISHWCHLSMCVVSPCDMLFPQELRVCTATLHRLWQHHLHHTQSIIFLLGPGLSAPGWLSWKPVAESGYQSRCLPLPRGCDWQRTKQPSSSSASSSPRLWLPENSPSSIECVFYEILNK